MRLLLKIIMLFLLLFWLKNVNAQTREQVEVIQSETDTAALKVIAAEASRVDAERKMKAHKIAKEKGWPIRKELANGQVIELQDIDVEGKPIYFTTQSYPKTTYDDLNLRSDQLEVYDQDSIAAKLSEFKQTNEMQKTDSLRRND